MNQQTAQGLASLGRGPDSMLVHMAPQEVAGLQALALKHGGSLTINPETGLPEAGFLSSILPMVAGFALGPAGFGLMSSAMAGLTVGGITALTSKSLSKGVMAGLGAYGGAGLGESLMGAGTGSLSSAAGAGVTAPPIGAVVPQTVVPAVTNVAPAVPEILAGAAQTVAAPIAAPVLPAINAAQIAPTITQAPALSQSAADIGNAYAQEQAAQNAVAQKLAASTPMDKLGAGFKAVTASPSAALNFAKANAMPLGALGISALSGLDDKKVDTAKDPGMIRPYTYSREKVPSAFMDVAGEPLSSKERRYFNDQYTALAPYKAPGPEYMAEGGPVEAMSDANAIGMNTGYPQSGIRTGAYATPDQQPISRDMLPYAGQPQFAGGGSINLQGTFSSGGGQGGASSPAQQTQPFIGSNNAPSMGLQTHQVQDMRYRGGDGVTPMPGPAGEREGMPGGLQGLMKNMSMFAEGGLSNLGDYSDGGRLLRGPGDGVSDDIPATIGQKQQARLADGEFVVPARIVSELGNGSTEAGARQLYSMMDRVQKARKKTVGKDKVATDSRAAKLLPA